MSLAKHFKFQVGTEGITYDAKQMEDGRYLITWECGAKSESDVYPAGLLKRHFDKSSGVGQGWFITKVIEQ